MSDITFDCGWCGQSIVIDEAATGQLVDCPKCGKPLEVPYKSKPLDKAPPPSPAKPPEPQRQLEKARRKAEDERAEQLRQTKREAPNMDTAKQGSVSTKTFVLSFIVVGVAVLISGVLFYMAVVKPLRIQVQELTDTVNHNAEAANLATRQLGDALDSLTHTVNRNAEALNSLTHTVNRNAEALDSLTDTVNRNAEIANLNNRLR